jgi:hypothetical protein
LAAGPSRKRGLGRGVQSHPEVIGGDSAAPDL